MRPFIFGLIVLLAVGCLGTTEEEKDTPPKEDAVQPVKADSYEMRIMNIDELIDGYEHTGGFTGSYLMIGNQVELIEVIGFFVDEEIIKIETYMFRGSNKKICERLYFQDKRIVRYDKYERSLDEGRASLVREERYYFDNTEKLVRSMYRENISKNNGTPNLEAIQFSPMILDDIKSEQMIILDKMLNYTMRLGKAEEIDLNQHKFNWPDRDKNEALATGGSEGA